jgi:acyl carrier protein
MNKVDVINKCLSDIGIKDRKVTSLDDNIFDLELTSIERLMFISKFEDFIGAKINIASLGTESQLTVRQLGMDCE